MRLIFEDSSYTIPLLDEIGFRPPGTSRAHDDIDDLSDPLDVGVALLRPISTAEVGGIERLLGELEDLVRYGDLDRLQEERILAMADLIRDTRSECEPDVTLRWKVVGATRGAIRYALKDLPSDGLALVKFAEILDDMGWTSILP